ncbi:MAG: SapC family protein [Desulfobacteraceae bacterium]|nr:SapC family protein [Desulfobacteraceae bacterium]
MTHLSAITKNNHADKSWTRFTSYNFAGKECIAPLVSAEIPNASLSMPLAFVKQKDHFMLVAVLSLTPGTNLFVAPSGQWLGKYIPSAFRGYPFRLARGGPKNEMLLCVDEDSGLVNEDKNAGEPFFDDNKELSKPVKDILQFLSQVEQNKTATDAAVASLADADLLTEWSLKIKLGDREEPVTGLYRIDEAKLNSLDDDWFLKLRKAGSLPIAYAQMLSMGNIQIFEKMSKVQEQAAVKNRDVVSFLGDDDVISFQ